MKPGLYAMASLDGAPLPEDDLADLHLASRTDKNVHHLPGMAVRLADTARRIPSTSIATQNAITLFFLGYLDEPEELASRLGLDHAASNAALAFAALEKWNMDANPHLRGEWCLLSWNQERCELVVGASQRCFSPLYIATDGRRLAAAPAIHCLSSLAWVGKEIDPAGFALEVARTPLRRKHRSEQTLLRRVTALEPGGFRRFSLQRQSTSSASLFQVPQERWTGSFENAVYSLEQTARRVMRQTLTRHDRVAILLSGGLDSSALAWLAAEEQSGQKLFCLTSVAPEGSGLPDERKYARIVADHLSLPLIEVAPPPEANPFRPAPHLFSYEEWALRSPRHYLYDALGEAAEQAGAEAVMDGMWGEQSLTRYLNLHGPKNWLREYRSYFDETVLRSWKLREAWPQTAFSVRLSRSMLEEISHLVAQPLRSERPQFYAPNEKMGFGPGLGRRNAALKSAIWMGRPLRHLLPYRDERLLNLAATMPARFTERHGFKRAIVREMLTSRLPDSIRLRIKPMPFSPDYTLRLQRHAGSVLERLADYRAADIGEWLDLAWLEQGVKNLASGDARKIYEHFKIQMTACSAEYLLWWKTAA